MINNCLDWIYFDLFSPRQSRFAALERSLNKATPDSSLAAVQYAYKPWTNFVRECELFSLAPTCTAGEPCSKPVSESPWWLRSLALLFRPATYEYGTGVVPNKGDGWQYYADEGEVSQAV